MSVAQVVERIEGIANSVVIRHDRDFNEYIVCLDNGDHFGFHTVDREDARITARILAGPDRETKPLERRDNGLFPRGRPAECPSTRIIRRRMERYLAKQRAQQVA